MILTWVVPQFEQLFEDMGQALPLATQVVISSANFLVDYGIFILLLLVALGFGLSRLLQQQAFSPELGSSCTALASLGRVASAH